MSITLYAKLDMTPGAVPTVVHRSQYDSDFTLVFSLYTRTGDFVIASGTTARMRGTKTTGTGYSVPVTLDVSAKTVTVTGDQQMTAAAGSNIFEIVLYQGDLEICSSNFILQVERAAMDADTITDETVVPELEHLEEYTQQAAEQAARSASVYAESWAVGGTGTREGEDTNNAKYWSEQAQGAVSGVASFNGRTGVVVPATGDYKSEMIRRGNSTTTVEDTLTSLGNTATDLRSRMYTQEDYTSDLRSRMSIAENAVSNHSTRLGTAESDIYALEGRATTAESNITTLQNNKVDMTTPLLNFDDTATDPLTDDGALANALAALGILSDVILSGGGKLYIKKMLTKILSIEEEMLTLTYNGKSTNIYFRTYGGVVLSILIGKETESVPLPTTWTNIGTLTKIKPASDRYIPFISSNGLTGSFRIFADGGVRIVAHSSSNYWMQTSVTVIYK